MIDAKEKHILRGWAISVQKATLIFSEHRVGLKSHRRAAPICLSQLPFYSSFLSWASEELRNNGPNFFLTDKHGMHSLHSLSSIKSWKRRCAFLHCIIIHNSSLIQYAKMKRSGPILNGVDLSLRKWNNWVHLCFCKHGQRFLRIDSHKVCLSALQSSACAIQQRLPYSMWMNPKFWYSVSRLTIHFPIHSYSSTAPGRGVVVGRKRGLSYQNPMWEEGP